MLFVEEGGRWMMCIEEVLEEVVGGLHKVAEAETIAICEPRID
jgi:hypothetical protein